MNQRATFITDQYGRPRVTQIGFRVASNGCWLWTGKLHKGYGRHRMVYERLRGPVPENLTLDHLCRNITCVNPDHMEPVTQSENTKRAARDAPTWGRPRKSA